MSERPGHLSALAAEPRAPAEFNAKILSALARWVAKHHGAAKLDELASSSAFRASEIDGATHWLSLGQVEHFNALARGLVSDDAAFLRACGEEFFESMGPVRLMVRALSVQQFFESAAKMSKQMLRASRFEVLESSRLTFGVRYTSDKAESRLLCLSRQAAFVYGPTMWGLPLAQLIENGCVANGDKCCEYQLSWFQRSRRTPVLAGFGVGALAALFIPATVHPWTAFALLPLFGAGAAHLFDLRRTSASNLRFANDVNAVLRTVGDDEAEARSEIVALNQRQREWIRVMEEQVQERTAALEGVVKSLDGIQETRVSSMKGFSHDLRNPLFVLRGNTQFLADTIKGGLQGDALRDMETAAAQIEVMLTKLMAVVTADTGLLKLAPVPVAVAPLVETFRRRLKALVHGREIKVTVFCSREAPDEIVVDPLVFDRVVDNILTNAAKYTDKGSILLEICGTPATSQRSPGESGPPASPGFLTLKLCDTGQGIPAAQVDRIFRPRPANEPAQRANSYGIGLSSVVRLLAQIGGRLDVMTKAGVGTTFWAHFPASPPSDEQSVVPDDNLESMIMRVVTIRKAEAL